MFEETSNNSVKLQNFEGNKSKECSYLLAEDPNSFRLKAGVWLICVRVVFRELPYFLACWWCYHMENIQKPIFRMVKWGMREENKKKL